MIKFSYLFLMTGLCCLLELLLRNFGFFFPCCALFVFYAATAFGFSWGVGASCLGALGRDFAGAGASHPWSVLILIGIAYLAELWLQRVESDSVLVNFLPGLLIPLLVWLYSLIFFTQHFWTVLVKQLPVIFPVSVLCAVCLPGMILLLDSLNEKLSLPLFADARQKRKSRPR